MKNATIAALVGTWSIFWLGLMIRGTESSASQLLTPGYLDSLIYSQAISTWDEAFKKIFDQSIPSQAYAASIEELNQAMADLQSIIEDPMRIKNIHNTTQMVLVKHWLSVTQLAEASCTKDKDVELEQTISRLKMSVRHGEPVLWNLIVYLNNHRQNQYSVCVDSAAMNKLKRDVHRVPKELIRDAQRFRNGFGTPDYHAMAEATVPLFEFTPDWSAQSNRPSDKFNKAFARAVTNTCKKVLKPIEANRPIIDYLMRFRKPSDSLEAWFAASQACQQVRGPDDEAKIRNAVYAEFRWIVGGDGGGNGGGDSKGGKGSKGGERSPSSGSPERQSPNRRP